MKVEVTHVDIVDDGKVVATVQLVDENVVQVNIKQVVGWNEWLDLTDAVRRVMVLMEVKND
jgi:hypothetical protein